MKTNEQKAANFVLRVTVDDIFTIRSIFEEWATDKESAAYPMARRMMLASETAARKLGYDLRGTQT